MKQLSTETKRDRTIKHKQRWIVVLLVSLLMFLVTGCQVMDETFGKEYRMIDDFFEQLDSDVRFTFKEFAATQDLTTDQKSYIDAQLNVLAANLKVAKADMKLMIRYCKENAEALGGRESIEAHLEQTLLEARMEIEEQVKEKTNGQLVLKSTEVNRGFFGSIWHFIRNHWLISLIILVILITIIEKLQEIFERIFKKKENDA